MLVPVPVPGTGILSVLVRVVPIPWYRSDMFPIAPCSSGRLVHACSTGDNGAHRNFFTSSKYIAARAVFTGCARCSSYHSYDDRQSTAMAASTHALTTVPRCCREDPSEVNRVVVQTVNISALANTSGIRVQIKRRWIPSPRRPMANVLGLVARSFHQCPQPHAIGRMPDPLWLCRGSTIGLYSSTVLIL